MSTATAKKREIRLATHEDIPAMVEMGRQFVASKDYQGKTKIDTVASARLLKGLIENPEGLLLIYEVAGRPAGMLGMILFDHHFSGERCASELFWWIAPGHRGSLAAFRMLKKGTDWGKQAGARVLIMVAPNERVSRLYQRLGFERVECSFQKRY